MYDTNPLGKRELKDSMSFGLSFRSLVVALAYDPKTALSAPSILGPLMEFVKLLREYDGPVFVEVGRP
jgi:hypothetical protein